MRGDPALPLAGFLLSCASPDAGRSHDPLET
jgi:hypothetical protein